jgi:hypothetical protein
LKGQLGAATRVGHVGAARLASLLLLRIAIVDFFIIARFFIIVSIGIILLLVGGFDRPHEGVDHLCDVSAPPDVISPFGRAPR